MPKYIIQVPVSAWVEVEVEAEGEKDALDAAYDDILASPLARYLTENTQDWELDPIRSAWVGDGELDERSVS